MPGRVGLMGTRIPQSRVPGFSVRLQMLIGDGETQQGFALKIGTSLSNLKKWLSGEGMPRLDNAIAISDATGASIHWLATGEGPPQRAALREVEGLSTTPAIDETVMVTVVSAVYAAMEQRGIRLSPEPLAKVIAAAYDFTMAEADIARRSEIAARSSERILRLVS